MVFLTQLKGGKKKRAQIVYPSQRRATPQSAMLHAAGTDAAVEERKGSTGDHAGLIRLPLFPQNEFTVIEYKEKKNPTHLCVTITSIAHVLRSSFWEVSTTNTRKMSFVKIQLKDLVRVNDPAASLTICNNLGVGVLKD